MPEFGIDEETRRKQRDTLRKRSTANLENRYAMQNRIDLEEAEAAMAPPVITIPQCQTCQHPKRYWIERQVMKGVAYARIAGALEHDPSSPDLDRRSISNHAKTHMPLDQAVIRAVLEEEANLIGQNWEEGVRGAITTRGMFNVMMRKAFEDAMAGITTIEPRDFVQMAKAYNDMVSSESVMATEEAKTAVRIFMEAIQNVVQDMLSPAEGEEMKVAIAMEVKRLRQRDEIEIEVERSLRALPSEV